jgi:PAS domain S-box-containing protein
MPHSVDSADLMDAAVLAVNRPGTAVAWPASPRPRRYADWLRAKPPIVAIAVLLVVLNTMFGTVVVRGLHNGYAQVRTADAAAGILLHLRDDAGEMGRDVREALLSGQPRHVDQYRAARARLTAEIGQFQALIDDRPDLREKLDALAQAVAQQASALDTATRGAPPAADIVRGLAGKERQNQTIHELIDAIEAEQLEVQAERLDVAAAGVNRAFAISETRTLVSAGLVALLLLLIWRDRQARAALVAERATALADVNQALSREAAERHQAEQALRDRELMLRGLTDAIPQMVYVLFPYASGQFLNPRWHDYTGAADRFSREAGWDRVHPDDAAGVIEHWRQAKRHRAPFAAEFRLRGRDGQYRWFLAQSVPIPDSGDGRGPRWVGALTDIDDVRRADAALRESEDRFRRIFEGSPFGITLSEGLNRRILQANPAFCQMLGYTRDELIGRSLIAITHPDEAVEQRIFPTLEGVGPGWRTREKRYLTKEGAVVWARIRVSVFDPLGGGGPQLLAVVEDITHRRETEEALRQAQRMEAIGRLSGGLAHDFNNLLGVIIGNVECLLETLADDPERTELAQEVLQSALGGAELTHRLLAFGRRQSLSPQQIDLGAEAARHIKLLRRTLGAAIRVETVFDDDLWPVQADPSQLGDALLNLGINARDAMPHGGVLTIDAYNDRVLAGGAEHGAGVSAGEYAVLAVSDTGTGMRPEVRDRAVEPFFTTKPPGAGSGLGLSMIYGFVRQSGGHLTIASEVGVGTTVSIFLPRTAGAAQATAACQAASPGLPTGCETILVVDDSAEMRHVAERHLSVLGYSVQSAGNGPAALSLLRDGAAVDLLFTDITMPEGLTGFQLAEAACAMRPGLKVLFTTGYAGMGDPAGASDWQQRLIRKPYRRPELAKKIRAVLSS